MEVSVCSWPILLKKSDLFFTAEKCAFEIEISNRREGIQAQFSRSSAQKRCFHRSVFWPLAKTEFFNRIGRFPPVVKGRIDTLQPFASDRNRSKVACLRFMASLSLL